MRRLDLSSGNVQRQQKKTAKRMLAHKLEVSMSFLDHFLKGVSSMEESESAPVAMSNLKPSKQKNQTARKLTSKSSGNDPLLARKRENRTDSGSGRRNQDDSPRHLAHSGLFGWEKPRQKNHSILEDDESRLSIFNFFLDMFVEKEDSSIGEGKRDDMSFLDTVSTDASSMGGSESSSVVMSIEEPKSKMKNQTAKKQASKSAVTDSRKAKEEEERQAAEARNQAQIEAAAARKASKEEKRKAAAKAQLARKARKAAKVEKRKAAQIEAVVAELAKDVEARAAEARKRVAEARKEAKRKAALACKRENRGFHGFTE
jgi:hypothetical protein